MSYAGTPGPGGAVDPRDAGPQPFHRLLRNDVAPRAFLLLGALTVLVGWMFFSLLILSIQRGIRTDPEGTVSWLGLLATNLSLIVLIPLTMIVATLLNKQTPGLLSSVIGKLRWRPLVVFGVAAVVLELVMLGVIKFGGIGVLGDGPDGIASDAAGVIAVTLLTSTFQAAGEEYFFRGYLLQAVGALVRSSLVAVLVTTVLFTMAHGIWPWESPALFLDRFAFGLVAGLLAVRTGGLEASIAAHAANNVITFIYAALTNTVGDSLGASDAPWSLVAVDVVKFAAFGAIALLLAGKQGMATRCELPLATPLVMDRRPGRRLV
ncbi:CPBP family intramembrane glutamic endopeptidase [Streptomyces sp. SID13031]|uniref:CPBP family intramembrane glutamic endopeptidase n=1 Tax=Streptomyces sp. SID13031 TaxID=2706046 RepID=UPI0013CDDC76|nr:CPBP family intramembrane glutamic endopeptidase [Streptomyces sp. SID13031]NEA35288.1 CPBP family intramembrane metalloprotease [Streptomyces sp. SID13031]